MTRRKNWVCNIKLFLDSMTVTVGVMLSPKDAGLWLGCIELMYECSGFPSPCLVGQSSIEQLALKGL